MATDLMGVTPLIVFSCADHYNTPVCMTVNLLYFVDFCVLHLQHFLTTAGRSSRSYLCITCACLGYSTQVLGIQNHCRFRDLHHAVELCSVANVVPSLPLLELTTSLPKSTGFSSVADSECVVSSALMTVYAGQR